MKITIKGNEIELKYSIRALMMYENVEGKTFQPKSLQDIMTFFYCVVISSSKDYSITFDDFIDFVDEDNTLITNFTEWLLATTDNQNKLKKD